MPTLTQSLVRNSSVVLPLLLWRQMADDDGGEDPLMKKFPLGYRDAWKISWEQDNNPWGMTAQGALDAPPVFTSIPGSRVFEATPGVYREYTKIGETELTVAREQGTLGDPISVKGRLAKAYMYFAERLANRLFKIYADLGVYGRINNTDDQGNQHVYQIQDYPSLSVSAWLSSPQTATPIDDLRTAQTTLHKGTSSRFGPKSQLLLTDEALNAFLATKQVRDTFRANYGANYLAPYANEQATGVRPPINGDRSVNELLTGMGLPKLVPWNRGYYPDAASAESNTKASFTKFLPTTAAIWLGYRPDNAQLGQLSFARHTGLQSASEAAEFGVVPLQKPGSLSEFGKGVFVQVKYQNEQPHHYKMEIGFNVCPEVWYNDAMASINWS